MVYYAIAPGAFLSPVIVSKLGTQLTMGVGALTYTAVCSHTILSALGLVVHSDAVVPVWTYTMRSTQFRSSHWSMDLSPQGGL